MNRCARCNWQPEDGETLPQHAEAASHPLCTACPKPTSLPPDRPRVCRDCQDTASTHLAEVIAMWQELPDLLGQHASERLPGGDVLVLAGPGSRGPQGADDPDVRRLIDDNRMYDVPSVAWTLVSWADDWRDVRGEQHPDRDAAPATSALVADAHAYLVEHSAWAAAVHWAWPDFAADLRHVHRALMHATGRHRSPTHLGLLCFACRGQLVYRVIRDQDAPPAPRRPRWWVDVDVAGPVNAAEYARRSLNTAGLEEEHATCNDCGQTYTAAALLLAQRAAVEDAQWLVDDDGTRWGTVQAVADYVHRSHWSLRTWRRQGLVRSSQHGGEIYLHLSDVEQLASTTATRTRRPA